ncbi:MAG: DNA replication/repair protein RecF, partial [Dehalococcoidia bacterium]|nr:DNA replication/repair protein RecF [Dehalococcoidia bacterium]
MVITHLSLANYRNYRGLELDLPPGPVVFEGDNAQGKSNLLEAVYLLATSRSSRALTERELINWSALEEVIPVCRLKAGVQRARGKGEVELTLLARKRASADDAPLAGEDVEAASCQKRIKINGVVRRAADLLGVVTAVLFSSADLDLVRGAPSLRRRYLDILNCQIDPHYLRSLQRYNRVLVQRNHLLRLISERSADVEQLAFWDREMVSNGAYILWQRCRSLRSLNSLAQAVHHDLTGGQERIDVVHVERLLQDDFIDIESEQALGEIEGKFAEALKSAQHSEIARGMSLVGPHRSDLRFMTNGVNMGAYGSRGQLRTIALSMRLGEARLMLARTGDQPVVLLDDVLSELDDSRRHYLLSAVESFEQTLITTTDLRCFGPAFLSRASLYR